jgi:CheY-like chemotaxis protein/DNA-binding XRE family transcriptional regulator
MGELIMNKKTLTLKDKNVDLCIAQKLKEVREKRNLTLKEVGAKFGISLQQIQKYEQGQSRMSAIAMYNFSVLYGLDMEKFFSDIVHKISEEHNDLVDSSICLQEQQRQSINLLLVEDAPGDEALVRIALENEKGVKLFCVHDGDQAIDFLCYKKTFPDFQRTDLILLDIELPKRPGIKVLEKIKSDAGVRGIPVIILTNNINHKTMVAMYKAGASGYISKLYDFDDFKIKLIECINYWKNTVILP